MILYILDMYQFEASKYCRSTSRQKNQHHAGRFLLRRALGEEIYKTVEFAQNEYGKPYIVGYPIHYNISHSGQYTLLVTAEADVGVDVQEKRSARMEAMAKRYFSEEEIQAFLACADEKGKKDMFYHIWCRKEAYGKYLGVGLDSKVLKCNVLENAENKQNETDAMTECEFRDLSISDEYQISICSRKGEHLEKIVSVFEGL